MCVGYNYNIMLERLISSHYYNYYYDPLTTPTPWLIISVYVAPPRKSLERVPPICNCVGGRVCVRDVWRGYIPYRWEKCPVQ